MSEAQVEPPAEEPGAPVEAAPDSAARSVAGASDEQAAGPTTNAEDLAEAAAMREESQGAAASAGDPELERIPSVIIDEGTFKYVLLKVTAGSGAEKFLVRGSLAADYHKDVAAPYNFEYRRQGLKCEVMGGGRILHNSRGKLLQLYGFSYGFSWLPGMGHAISADLCREAYPDYEVSWSDQGY